MSLNYCPSCGAQVTNNAQWCTNCGAPLASQPAPESNVATQPVCGPESNQAPRVCPEDHLTKAILVTILCCWPLGIPAIINASGVQEAFRSGNYDLAVEKSKKAKKWINWCIIGAVAYIVLILLIYAIYFIIILLAAGEL